MKKKTPWRSKIPYKNISLKNVQDPKKKIGDGVVGCHEVIIIEC